MPDGVLLLAQGGVRGRRLRPAAGPARLLPARADPDRRAPARGQHRLRPPPAPLGGGADARLARPLAQAGQGLRGAARGLRDHGQAGDDPAHAAPPRPPEPQAAARSLTSQTASKSFWFSANWPYLSTCAIVEATPYLRPSAIKVPISSEVAKF